MTFSEEEFTDKDSLIVTQNDDGTFLIEWDPNDPRYSYLNNLTEEEVTEFLNMSVQKLLEKDNESEESD